MLEIKEKINQLVEKYEKNRDYYLTSHFNETMLRSEFLDSFFELLGWDIKNVCGKNTSEREVLLEEPLKADVMSHTKKPDYTFRLYGERKFFVEAKKPCVHIEVEDAPARQVRRYGYTANLKISVLSNFEWLFIYETTRPVDSTDTRTMSLVKGFHYKDYADSAGELLNLLGKDSVYSGTFDELWSSVENKVEHQSVDIMFLRQINEWRLLLGKQILEVVPGMDVVHLGDIVQSYINKVLFLRVCEDRNIETYQRLLQIADHNSYKELVRKFREADKKYNSGLFASLLSDKIIEDISSSFWTIIHQLYYPESIYSYAVLSSDILGRIYEIFLSQRLALVDGKLTLVNKPENIDRDIVTTPNFIIREILRQTVEKDISVMDAAQVFSLKCADIACGSGAFLLELFQLLCDYLVDYYKKHDVSRLIHTEYSAYKLCFEDKRRILVGCIYGVDKDFNAVEACKFGLLLKLLEGENNTTIESFNPILPSLNNNVFYGNSLLAPSDIKDEQTEEINPFDFNGRIFDYIVGNPPYMKTEEMKNIIPMEYAPYILKYKSAHKQFDKYFLFMERALSLLKDGGKLGYIVPNKFMKVGSAKCLREIISKGRRLKALVSFGANQVFADKSTYTCIIVLQNSPCDKFSYSEVNDLNKWIARDNSGISTCQRNAETIGEGTWVICTDGLNELLENKVLAKSKPLSEVVGSDNIFNGIQTSASKIYVITPSKEDDKYYYFKAVNKCDYKIEKKMTKPFFKTGKGADSLYSYKSFIPNARVLFPYVKKRSGKLEIRSLKSIEQLYPCCYAYLMDMKGELSRSSRDIQPAPLSENEWYRYGRQQSLEACEVTEKIIVGVLAQEDKYAIDTNGTLVASGGTAGYCIISVPKTIGYSIYYLQAILGSVQGEWLASLYGEVFRGGYIARGTKVLKQIPIRTIDFSNQVDRRMHDDIADRQKELIALGTKLQSAKDTHNIRKENTLQRMFNTMRSEQQKAINRLYGMTSSEVQAIPKVKDFYATD